MLIAKNFSRMSIGIFTIILIFLLLFLQLMDVLQISLKYSILQSSKLEGIEVHEAKFRNIFMVISSKPYDALNHRKPDFDVDYDIFKQAIDTADEDLRAYKKQILSATPNVTVLQTMIKRY